MEGVGPGVDIREREVVERVRRRVDSLRSPQILSIGMMGSVSGFGLEVAKQ